MVSYELLWKKMAERKITTYALINRHNINARTVNNLKHNKSVTVYTLERLCEILDCRIEEILTISFDK